MASRMCTMTRWTKCEPSHSNSFRYFVHSMEYRPNWFIYILRIHFRMFFCLYKWTVSMFLCLHHEFFLFFTFKELWKFKQLRAVGYDVECQTVGCCVIKMDIQLIVCSSILFCWPPNIRFSSFNKSFGCSNVEEFQIKKPKSTGLQCTIHCLNRFYHLLRSPWNKITWANRDLVYDGGSSNTYFWVSVVHQFKSTQFCHHCSIQQKIYVWFIL